MAFFDAYEIAAYKGARKHMGFLPALFGAVAAVAPVVTDLLGNKKQSSVPNYAQDNSAQIAAQLEAERQRNEQIRREAEERAKRNLKIVGGVSLGTIALIVVAAMAAKGGRR